MTEGRCDCVFNSVCKPWRQKVQRDWVTFGEMKPEEAFGPLCPHYDTETENQYYEINPRDAA